MSSLIFRITALLLHMLANIAIVIYLSGYDITGSWLRTTGFVLAFFVLFLLFIRHIISFINFIKSRP